MVVNKTLLQLLQQSPLFDPAWYLKRYPDVANSGMTPAMHYLLLGCKLQRDPGPDFSCIHYLAANPQVHGQSAFLHFLVATPAAITDLAKSELNPPIVSAVTAELQHSVIGDLNVTGDADTVIRGWLASATDSAARHGQIWLDGQLLAEVHACTFREDLLANGIHSGEHAFEVVLPLSLVDGQEHRVELHDTATGTLVKTACMRWQIQRTFTDFSGFLAHSLTNPYFRAPFREEDKACFAVMENIALSLHQQADALRDAPLVTVIMPCFNRLDTIAEAVDSVLAQQYKNFELILVDDASSDGTLQWCQRQTDPRIKLISLTQNGGAAAARNAGVNAARGQYLMYLDSDNNWDPRYIGAMVGAFARLPDADALYSGQLLYQGKANQPAAVRFGSFNKSLLFNNNYIDMNAFCHTRSSMQAFGGFDPQFKRFEDWDLFLNYVQHGKMYSVPVLLSNYYLFKADNSLTAEQKYAPQLHEVRAKHKATLPVQIDSALYQVQRCEPSKTGLNRRIAVVIPSYQALDDLRQCIESLYQLQLSELLQIIVVDNASAPDVVSYIQQQTAVGRIQSICNTKNYGFTYAVNQGAALADANADIVLLNNDAVVMPGALEAMQQTAWQIADCAMVVPQQILPGGTDTLTTHVPYANPVFACDVNLSMHHANIIHPPLFHDGGATEICFAAFFCVYIRRDAYNRAGPLDAQYGRHYRSDRIYCDFVRHVLGMKIFHQPAAKVFHKLQRSTQTLQKTGQKTGEFELMFRKNQWDLESQREMGYVTARWDI
jgi:GT2 family glycosyltransferase